MAMVDDVSAKVLSDLGLHGYEHYGPDRVDAVAGGHFVRTGFWAVPDLANKITRAAAVTTVDTIRWSRHRLVRESREATIGTSPGRQSGDHNVQRTEKSREATAGSSFDGAFCSA